MRKRREVEREERGMLTSIDGTGLCSGSSTYARN